MAKLDQQEHEAVGPVNLHQIESLERVAVQSGISLRLIVQADAPKLLKILQADPSIRDHVVVAARMHSEEDVTTEIAAMQEDPGLIRYAIVDEQEGCIGLVSFWRDDGFFGQQPRKNAYGFGYFLDPVKRGTGIVTEAVRSLMEIAQRELTVAEFIAFCEDENQASISVLKKLGFIPTEHTHTEQTHGWIERLYSKPLQELGDE